VPRDYHEDNVVLKNKRPPSVRRIRPFRHEDIPFAVTQTEREGWDSTPVSFEVCLKHDPEGCFIAEADGEPAGMVTTTRYARTAWIGHLIVAPEHRMRGVGRALMERAMALLADRGVATIRLEADPPGMHLYRQLGFAQEFESLRFRLSETESYERGPGEPIEAGDLGRIAAFDTDYFGDDRGRLLELLFGQADAALQCRESGRLTGYLLAVPGRGVTRLGPWVAAKRDVAEKLLRLVSAELPGRTFAVGVPAVNREASDLFRSQGFKQYSSSFRMVYGEPAGAGRTESIYGIANGAMG
jgi:ribosomal protein S18 acetylase RimI-like enzyme